jgi:hypothetical protein
LSWYKFAVNNLNAFLDEQERNDHINSKHQHEVQPTNDEGGEVLENQINKVRKNIVEDPKIKNEAKQPNNYFSHGQGGDFRMQEGRDQPWNQTPDNFTTQSPWNS